MTDLTFAIAGCGRIGKRHAGHIQKNGKLTAVCDIDIEAAEEVASEYNCKAFTSYDEFLKNTEADVVSICTPNGVHAAQTIKALEAGFHVLCEKPMAISVEDCGRMIDTSLRTNKKLFIVKQNRFNPPVEAVKKAIHDGALGKILSVQLNCFWNRNNQYYENSWKGTADMDGGTLYTQFSHFIDLLYWMIGDVKSASGYRSNRLHKGIIDFEDNGSAILKFYNGAIGTVNYTLNSFGGNMEGSLTIFGEKGTIKIGGQYLNELEYQRIEDYEISGLPPGNPPNQYGHYQGSMSNHGEVYENVVKVLTGNGEIATNGFEGLKTVEIIDKIYTGSEWID